MAMQLTGKPVDQKSVLVFEWLCGGGLLVDRASPKQTESLWSQGHQMLTAVCSDLTAAGMNPVVPLDDRLSWGLDSQVIRITRPQEVELQLKSTADEVDDVLVIAPETNGRLELCLDYLSDFSDKWLNPNARFTELCCQKNKLQPYLAGHSIAVPNGCAALQWDQLKGSFSGEHGFVIKPNNGCGGENMSFYRSLDQVVTEGDCTRVEEFVPGLPVSVSVICTPERIELLPALRQEFESQPIGAFVRCIADLDSSICQRAERLAKKVVAALPKTNGYFGIDMVLGSRDVVIEVNPRITMSYPVLRDKLDFNLADLMLGRS